MKNKNLSFFTCLVLIFYVITAVLPANAAADDETAVGRAQKLSDEIVVFKAGLSDTESIQKWIDTSLSEGAGASSEWYIIALSQSGEYDFSEYKKSLDSYLSANEVRSATTRQKIALTYIAIGHDSAYIAEVTDNSFGELGIMSWVYGLHLLNNGISHETETTETVISKLLELQLEDGGWALTGTKSDVDVTAMTVQSLAPYYGSVGKVSQAVDKALDLLSTLRLDDGGFSAYGTPNPESAAQVIAALSSLGIDCGTDERFIKNGISLFDSLEKYRLSDGSFSHTPGGEYSDSATAQVFFALIAYQRFVNEKGDIYILDNRNKTESEFSVPAESVAEQSEAEKSDMQNEKTSYKVWVSVAIIAAGVIISLVLFIAKKRNKKNFIAVFAIVLIAVCFVLLTDLRSADSYYNTSGTKKEAVGTVTVTIRCDTVAGKTDPEYIPENGIILEETEFEIAEGDSVYGILTEAARKHKIQVESKGAEGLVYISGINYLYEFDFGDLSGWMYFVNGEEPSKGCDAYILKDGDRIEWLYTCESGNDLK